jgi:hypothetical protein
MLPSDPFPLEPSQRLQYWPLEEGHILRQEQKPQRDHPESKHWQESDDSTDDEQKCDWNTHPARRWPFQPTQETAGAFGKSVGNSIDLPIKPFGVTVGHLRLPATKA